MLRDSVSFRDTLNNLFKNIPIQLREVLESNK